MFKKYTVFILGAGASWHYGYPTGERLVQDVLHLCDVAANYFHMARNEKSLIPLFVKEKLNHKPGDVDPPKRAFQDALECCKQLKTRLQQVDPLVIDHFLHNNEDLRSIGKLMIAWALRDRETQQADSSTNINRNQHHPTDNWYRFIVHKLVVGCRSSQELLTNKVHFVTFNYDVSLEDKLAQALRAISLFSQKDIDEFLGNNRFIHMYGQLRDPQTTAYTPLPRDLYAPKSIPEAEAIRRDERGTLSKWASMLDEIYDASKGIRTDDVGFLSQIWIG